MNMDNDEAKQQLEKLRKECAKKERKLQKWDRFEKRKAHVKQKLIEQDFLVNDQDSIRQVGDPAKLNRKIYAKKCSVSFALERPNSSSLRSGNQKQSIYKHDLHTEDDTRETLCQSQKREKTDDNDSQEGMDTQLDKEAVTSISISSHDIAFCADSHTTSNEIAKSSQDVLHLLSNNMMQDEEKCASEESLRLIPICHENIMESDQKAVSMKKMLSTSMDFSFLEDELQSGDMYSQIKRRRRHSKYLTRAFSYSDDMDIIFPTQPISVNLIDKVATSRRHSLPYRPQVRSVQNDCFLDNKDENSNISVGPSKDKSLKYVNNKLIINEIEKQTSGKVSSFHFPKVPYIPEQDFTLPEEYVSIEKMVNGKKKKMSCSPHACRGRLYKSSPAIGRGRHNKHVPNFDAYETQNASNGKMNAHLANNKFSPMHTVSSDCTSNESGSSHLDSISQPESESDENIIYSTGAINSLVNEVDGGNLRDSPSPANTAEDLLIEKNNLNMDSSSELIVKLAVDNQQVKCLVSDQVTNGEIVADVAIAVVENSILVLFKEAGGCWRVSDDQPFVIDQSKAELRSVRVWSGVGGRCGVLCVADILKHTSLYLWPFTAEFTLENRPCHVSAHIPECGVSVYTGLLSGAVCVGIQGARQRTVLHSVHLHPSLGYVDNTSEGVNLGRSVSRLVPIHGLPDSVLAQSARGVSLVNCCSELILCHFKMSTHGFEICSATHEHGLLFATTLGSTGIQLKAFNPSTVKSVTITSTQINSWKNKRLVTVSKCGQWAAIIQDDTKQFSLLSLLPPHHQTLKPLQQEPATVQACSLLGSSLLYAVGPCIYILAYQL